MTRTACTIVLLVVAPALCAAKPALKVEPAYPTVGRPATVTLTGVAEAPKGLRLKVTYRPASQTEETDDMGELGATGVRWTPTSPGVTKIAAVAPGVQSGGAGGGSKKVKPVATVTISTRYASAPVSGILVMLIAGLLLFGGAAWSMRVAMRGPNTERPMPYDT
jgi:hypothetical protein